MTLSIAVVGGGTIKTKNFISNASTVKCLGGFYYLGFHMKECIPDSKATKNPPYIISYVSTTQFFTIMLLQEPIGTIREEAERYLMNDLGISKNQMCQINYKVIAFSSGNSRYFDVDNLRFSFCPGATELPH